MSEQETLPASGQVWEHFHHEADIGVRGFGRTRESAFEGTACALTAVVTDVSKVAPERSVQIRCDGQDEEALLAEWLNALVYEMAVRKMLFSRFEVSITGNHLEATAWGEPIDRARHEPAAEVKGATYTELEVRQLQGGTWMAQCVVDV
ncbi:MAG: archease [Alphaproteobacteria bacterium]